MSKNGFTYSAGEEGGTMFGDLAEVQQPAAYFLHGAAERRTRTKGNADPAAGELFQLFGQHSVSIVALAYGVLSLFLGLHNGRRKAQEQCPKNHYAQNQMLCSVMCFHGALPVLVVMIFVHGSSALSCRRT